MMDKLLCSLIKKDRQVLPISVIKDSPQSIKVKSKIGIYIKETPKCSDQPKNLRSHSNLRNISKNSTEMLGLLKKAIDNKESEERRNVRNVNLANKVKLISPFSAYKKIDNKNYKTFATLMKKEKKLTPYQQAEFLRKEEREVMKKKINKKKFCFLIEKNNPFMKTMSVRDYSDLQPKKFRSIAVDSIIHFTSYTEKIKKLNEISEKNTFLPLLKLKKEKTTEEKGSQINFPMLINAKESIKVQQVKKNETI